MRIRLIGPATMPCESMMRHRSYHRTSIRVYMSDWMNQEESRNLVRNFRRLCWFLLLISLIELSGIFDFPGEWGLESLIGDLILIFIGIVLGISVAYGWPNKFGFKLDPPLTHEDE